jgi:basic membrane protein A
VDKCDIVISTDWGIAEACAQAARRHPKTLFETAGFDSENKDPNLGVYGFSETWHLYLQGIVAAALSTSGKIGYLSESQTNSPWVVQAANYFALGVKAANPKSTVILIYLPQNHWDVRGTDAAAAKTLIAQGCDFVCGTDHPDLFGVLTASTMAGKRVRMFHKDLSYKDAPNVLVSGPIRDFGELYARPLLALKEGAWKKEAVYLPSASKFGAGGEPFNPAFLGELRSKKVKTPDLGELSLLELVDKRAAQFLSGEFDPFTGPIKDQKGKLRVPAGARAEGKSLEGMDWLVDNVKVFAGK